MPRITVDRPRAGAIVATAITAQTRIAVATGLKTATAAVAAHSGAAVIPGCALWSEEERRYVLRFYPRVQITGDVQSDTERLQTRLESIIREHPHQWLWIHRRWKTRPPGEAPLYR